MALARQQPALEREAHKVQTQYSAQSLQLVVVVVQAAQVTQRKMLVVLVVLAVAVLMMVRLVERERIIKVTPVALAMLEFTKAAAVVVLEQ